MKRKKSCGSCRYWTRGKDECYGGVCSNDKFVERDDTPKDGLSYWDYECYSAGFNTGEDFGCIHWTPRDI